MRARIVVAAAAALVTGASAFAVGALVAPPPQVCENPDRSVTLYGLKISKRRYGYGLTPDKATIPGPALEMTEGECLAVTLVNEADRRMSVHAHGVDYTVASDGTPLNSSCVRPGRSRTYLFQAHGPETRADGTERAGSAGYWHYHDHCMGGAHGTDGIYAGVFGALIVRRPGDPVPDEDPFVVVMGPGSRINLKKAPKTPVFEAEQGQRIEFVVIGHGDDFHTFHLHGHRWADNRTGIPAGRDDATTVIDNKTVGPADSFGFQVIAGEGVGPGAWMFHCHVQGHSDAGMSAMLMVTEPGGTATKAGWSALQRWKRHEGGGRHEVHP